MKKAIAYLLILATISSTGSLYASAMGGQTNSAIPEVTVEYIPISVNAIVGAQSLGITDTGTDNGLRNYPVYNLGTNGSASINWTISAKGSIRSSYNYTTASGKIVLRVSASTTASINFMIYDSTGIPVAERTVQVTSNTTTVITYSNLFSNKQYYIKADNLSQVPTTVTGTIAAA